MDYLTCRWTNIVLLFYTTYISVYLTHDELFCAKVGKGGINIQNMKLMCFLIVHASINGSKTKN